MEDPVIFTELAKHLNDSELAKLCSSNKKIRQNCLKNNLIWQNRLVKYLGKFYKKIPGYENMDVIDIIDKFRRDNNMSWKDYYISTMSILDKVFIDLEDLNTTRSDIIKLYNVMERSDFNIYYDTLYRNVDVDEKYYRNADEADKRWMSPDMLIYHILIGNIKDEKLIKEIVYNNRITNEVDSVISNTQYDLSIKYNILEDLIKKYPDNPNNKYFKEAANWRY